MTGYDCSEAALTPELWFSLGSLEVMRHVVRTFVHLIHI